MRLTIIFTGVLILALLGSATLPKGDEPLEGRQELFATIADGDVAGDELLALQIKQLKTELQYIQLEVERFSVDNSLTDESEDRRYPHSVNQLVVEFYSEYRDAMLAYAQPGFYPNPFTATGADDLNAVRVPFGWNERAVGNFSYLTNLDDHGNVVSYLLVAYGDKLDCGFDIDGDGQLDGIVTSLSSGPMSEKNNKVFYDNGRMVVDGKLERGTAEVEQQMPGVEKDSPELVKAKEQKVKSEIHGVQIALERLSVDKGSYPQSMNLVVYPAWSEYNGKPMPYLDNSGFYYNALADNHAGEVNARCIPFGWTPDAPGNFSYLTQYDEIGEVSAYALVGYGAVRENGMDIDGDGVGDGIMIILWSGREYNLPPLESGIYEYYNCGRIVELPFTRP